MTGRCWLIDSGGSWLNAVTDERGELIADVAHLVGVFAPLNSTLRIEGCISVGATLISIRPRWWTVLECESDKKDVDDYLEVSR